MSSPFQVSYENVPAGLYSCHVALNGDLRQIVVRGVDNLCTLPEIYCLQHIHGQAAVTEVVQEKTAELSVGYAKDRIEQNYGKGGVEFLATVPLDGIGMLDSSIPTREAVDAGERAKVEAMASVSTDPAQETPSDEDDAPDAAPSVLPDLS